MDYHIDHHQLWSIVNRALGNCPVCQPLELALPMVLWGASLMESIFYSYAPPSLGSYPAPTLLVPLHLVTDDPVATALN